MVMRDVTNFSMWELHISPLYHWLQTSTIFISGLEGFPFHRIFEFYDASFQLTACVYSQTSI